MPYSALVENIIRFPTSPLGYQPSADGLRSWPTSWASALGRQLFLLVDHALAALGVDQETGAAASKAACPRAGVCTR